ncbi:MAG TPA: phospholipase D-like domain-containing protein [Azospirillum sp.]|nr:phospholipase D-like domain-containing protein [Azospirillum sp.]
MTVQEAVPYLVTLLHVAAAAAVTVHALLQKREVGSAIAWIGLAWLSPVVGSVLYVTLGINRVHRYAQQLQRPSLRGRSGGDDPVVPLDGLAIAVGRITGRGLQTGNRIDILTAGDGAYPQMLDAIAAARSSVALSSYIFRVDEAGEAFITALSAAQRRGVEVRVLIDGIGGGYLLSPAYRRLRAEGVPAARFLHSLLPWRMPFLNMRTHKKILVVDGRLAFTGGLNIGAENLLAKAPRHPVRDTHFRVEGPVVAQLMEAFAEDWLFASGERLSGTAWFPPLAAVGDVAARVVTSGPDHDIEKMEYVLLNAIAVARRSIRIATPYFLPDERLCCALEMATLRGISVDVVIPGKGNHPVLDWATPAQVRPMIAAGCRVWRAPPPFVHSKLMTVDGCWTLVGSANWDVRSLRLNFELDLEIHDDTFAAQVDAAIETRQCHRVTLADLDRLGFPIVLRDAAARLLLPYL